MRKRVLIVDEGPDSGARLAQLLHALHDESEVLVVEDRMPVMEIHMTLDPPAFPKEVFFEKRARRRGQRAWENRFQYRRK